MAYNTSDKETINLLNEPALRYERAQQGLSKSDMLTIVSMTGLSLTKFSTLLPVSKRTVEKVKDDELLPPVVSDRVIQLSSLFQHGAEVFGDVREFRSWLDTELLALGNRKPFEYLDAGTGISIVNDLLGRISHGVYS